MASSLPTWTEQFEIDENGDRWRLLINKKGEVFSRARADQEKAYAVMAQADATIRTAKVQELAVKDALLQINPLTATTVDIVRLLQYVVKKLV